MTQLNAQQTQELATNALQALTMAQDAVTAAKTLLAAAGVSVPQTDINAQLANAIGGATTPAANKSNKSNTSGGRQASELQMQIRQLVINWCTNTPGLFTNKSMVKALGKDKIQTRNAINALTDQGIIVRWAEKFSSGQPGAREIVYAPNGYDVGI